MDVLLKNAITGDETDAVPGTPRAALIDFYRAFNQRNMVLMANNWLPGDVPSMSNPLGGVKRGWAEIESVYQRIFNGPALVYVEYYDVSITETGDMFCAVGRERGGFKTEGAEIELAIRTTRIYQRHETHWRQLHHHGSIENPALLHDYQSAVMSTHHV